MIIMLRKCVATVTLVLFALAPVAGFAADSPAPASGPVATDSGRMAQDL